MNKIINILKEKKSIPLDQFINISLYDKKFGYYMKNNPFGKKGDFITSPQVSNLFGEMLAVWCVAFWKNIGSPNKITLVELGPGDGSLCENLLNAFSKFEKFYNSLEINLLEISEKLKKIQKSKVNNNKVKWIKNISEINSGPTIFLGNEFFDSLPIKQLLIKKKLYFEKHVTLSKNKKLKFFHKKANKNLVREIKKLNLTSESKIIEYPIKAIEFLQIIAEKINKYDGCLLMIDYGYTKNGNGNTLQSVKKHKYIDVFYKPGNSDITSLINFNLFQKVLNKNKLDVKKIASQGEFLQKIGILERANILAKKMTFREKANLFYRLKRLLDSKEMGNLFKVILAQKKGKKFSLGF